MSHFQCHFTSSLLHFTHPTVLPSISLTVSTLTLHYRTHSHILLLCNTLIISPVTVAGSLYNYSNDALHDLLDQIYLNFTDLFTVPLGRTAAKSSSLDY